MAKSTFSDGIYHAVYVPTAIAYVCLVVGYLRTGIALYAAFITGAYIVGRFKRIRDWPVVSRITLGCGPPLLGLGWYFSTQIFRSGMMLPAFIYLRRYGTG